MATLTEVHRTISALASDMSEMRGDVSAMSTRVGALEGTYERVRKAMWALTLAILGPFCATVFGVVGVLVLRKWGIT